MKKIVTNEKNFFKIIGAIIILICLGTIGFYSYVGYQFGQASKDAAKSYINLKKEWKEKGINLEDTIVKELEQLIDSTKHKSN